MREVNQAPVKGQTQPFVFAVGGNVQSKKGFYISRSTDRELLGICREANYASVLAPRQLGKSSLMVRTAEQLHREGIRSVIIDLSPIGIKTTDEQQWYLNLISEIAEQLNLDFDEDRWWEKHIRRGPTSALILFLQHVLLEQVQESVVIFLDEIDSTISLPFKDDFFATIRAVYQKRSLAPSFQRLSFVLIGVATPNDLISNPQRTPYNIGQRVDLNDFTLEEAMPLVEGFDLPLDEARQVLEWVFKWTGGHPYLTMRLCSLVANKGRQDWSEADINSLVASTFFGEKSDQDLNLQFVRDMLTIRVPRDVETTDVLVGYREIRRNRRPVLDDKRSLVKSHLKLSGVVKLDHNRLRVRNPIYLEVFDEQWIKEHLPPTWAKQQYERTRRVAFSLGLFLIALAILAAFAWTQRRAAVARAAELDEALVMVRQQRQRAIEAADNERKARQEADSLRETAQNLAASEKQARLQADARAADLDVALDRVEQQRKRAEEAATKERNARQEADNLRQTAVAAAVRERSARIQAEEQHSVAEARYETNKLYRDAINLYFKQDRNAAIKKLSEAYCLYNNRARDCKPLENNAPANNSTALLNDLEGSAITLSNIGAAYSSLDDRENALRFYNKSLDTYRQIANQSGRSGEASLLLNIGSVYERTKDFEKAIQKFNEALRVYQESKDKLGEANVLRTMALSDGNSPEETAKLLLTAATAYLDAGNPSEQANTLRTLADSYRRARKSNEAMAAYEQARKLYAEMNNHSSEATVLAALGNIYLSNTEKAEKQKAVSYYEAAAAAYAAGNDLVNQARTLKTIGDIHSKIGSNQDAINCYLRSLRVYEKGKNISGQVSVLQTIAALHYKSGKKDEAIEAYEQVLKLYRSDDNPTTLGRGESSEANMLRVIGAIYNEIGKHKEAMSSFNQSLELYKAAQQSSEIARTLRTIAESYYTIGDKHQALVYLKQIIQLHQTSKGTSDFSIYSDINSAVEAVKNIYEELGEKQELTRYYNELLSQYDKSGNLKGKGEMLMAISRSNLMDKSKALDYLQQASVIFQQTNESNVSLQLAYAFLYILGDKRKATEYAIKASEEYLSQTSKSYFDRDFVLYQLTSLFEILGERRRASEIYKQMTWGDVYNSSSTDTDILNESSVP